MQKKPRIAILYDFDKTLSTRDMQEYTFIPGLGMSADEFWRDTGALSKGEKMDKVLAYMYMMIKKSRDADKSLRREDFVGLGKGVKYYPGVETWFTRIDEYAKSIGAETEHYIISSGLMEIIEGTSIYKYFKQVFACEFLYDASGVVVWPKSVVNYTTKTQHLFRINKGVFALSDDDALNTYVAEDDRPIPFRNMIYIGDGLTDVPCMKLVKVNGGRSVAVYPAGTAEAKKRVSALLTDNRVDYILQADYSKGKELERTIKNVIEKMAIDDRLNELHRAQLLQASFRA